MNSTDGTISEMGRQLSDLVLGPMKRGFVGKDEVIDLLGVCLVGGENLFILGPPGTAKTALVQELASRLDGRMFDYLLTRFTEPNELFGPFDIRRLREGELVTNTEGMLPRADLVFLDPPYGQDLIVPALTALDRRGWIAGKALIVAEMGGRDAFAPPPGFSLVDERRYGKARIVFLVREA